MKPRPPATRFLEGNRITLLRCGAEYFPALERAIDAAQHEIYLQTYIFEDDESGRRIAEAFKRAAARNVKVCVLIDGFGSMGLSKKFVRELRDAHVNVLFYRPKISPFSFKRSRLRRLHSKVAVMDGEVASSTTSTGPAAKGRAWIMRLKCAARWWTRFSCSRAGYGGALRGCSSGDAAGKPCR
jgi:phosphatidylserine/phosphatidylglycerophosphate/cardiolipin synthase-like enzyme